MKTISDHNLLHYYLKRHHLDTFFPSFSHDQLQLLHYQKGEAICIQDQELKGLFYVVQGSIKIVRRLFNGKEHILETHSRPTIIGDIELMTNQNAVTSVIVLTQAYVIHLPLVSKENLLKDASFLYHIGQGLAQNFYQQNITSSTNITYTVKERLAAYILQIEEAGQFTLELSLLADSFGTSYRHLHRVLNQFLSQGIIKRTSFKNYQIISKKALQSLDISD
ncbi:cyclic nucleotide-binding domain-containing protein [Streptococcus ictaluri]|uniref:Cyclic nucleotide-binding domain protein n=1 Tax=Streptococcus ictaluri 707-05 TaxID=764299 RepID=G5JZS0_9STRE|nr:cyclic nucleotide-binding domain-containing protein [Streptococcus ictaluri]EHI70996.1 cyclic nucleotide-binding domain protein [Streptococcus ictaluri 707-05]